MFNGLDCFKFPSQVPYPLPPKRRQFLASRWIIHAARDRSGHSMPQKLATELLEAYNNQVQVLPLKTRTQMCIQMKMFHVCVISFSLILYVHAICRQLRVLLSKRSKTFIDWLKLIEPLHTLDGDV